MVTLEKFQDGPPPCHARYEDLEQLMLQAGTIAGRRKVKFNGEVFREGILESIIDLGREQLAVTMREARAQVREASPQTAERDDRAAVETGLRLVH
jgi:hypothetical protein